MATPQKIHIGILSPATADRPHFKSLEQMLPPEVTVTNEGLGLLQDSYQDLEGKTDEIAARAADFVASKQSPGTHRHRRLRNSFQSRPGSQSRRGGAHSSHQRSVVGYSSAESTVGDESDAGHPFHRGYERPHRKASDQSQASPSSPVRPTTKTANPEPALRSVPTSFSAESKQATGRIRQPKPSTSRAPPSIPYLSSKG